MKYASRFFLTWRGNVDEIYVPAIVRLVLYIGTLTTATVI
jgi:hypothetical protein